MKFTVKPCAKCGEAFTPTGPRAKLCNDCKLRYCTHCGEPIPLERTGVTCSGKCAHILRRERLPKKPCEAVNCDNEFSPKSPTSLFCSKPHYGECLICNRQFKTKASKKLAKFCPPCVKEKGNKQRNEAKRKTFMERYGVENAFEIPGMQERIQESNLQKYGVRNQFQREEVKEQIKTDNLEKYGVEHTGQREDVRAKIVEVNLERYGSKTPAGDPKIIEKMKKTNLERYGVENAFMGAEAKRKTISTLGKNHGVEFPAQSKEIKAKMNETLMKNYGVKTPLESHEILEKAIATTFKNYGVMNPMFSVEVKAKHALTLETPYGDKRVTSFKRISKLNKKFAKNINEKFKINDEIVFEKSVGSYSYDLYLSKAKLLIDLNPTITHNTTRSLACFIKKCELPCSEHASIPSDYHFKRALVAQEHGYKLIQIYDWDDPARTTNFLAGKLEGGFRKLSARKLTLKPITQKVANSFLEEHHIQGASKGQKHCYGLHQDDELLAVATFSKSRFKSKAEWEFNRYAVMRGYVIHGGAGKLFKAFLKEAEPTTIISYIDFDHTTGPVFLGSLGFNELRPTGPTLMWANPITNKNVPINSLLALGADRLLGTSYGPPEVCGYRNDEIMELEGFLRVYTSGNRVFVWEATYEK